MIRNCRSPKPSFTIVVAVLILALVALPVSADKPPDGYARPPIHLRGNASSTPPASALTPAQVRHAYGFDLVSNQGAGQTIAIVDAFDDPNIANDLAVFDSRYGIPCYSCFQKIYATTKPRTDSGWALEIALDVEWAHAIAPRAKILLVEAHSNSFTDLLKAVDVAVSHGASVVSMSWGGSDTGSGENHFAHNDVVFTAASGDSGHDVEFPASSPHVLGVGGTTLKLSYGNYAGEVAWKGSGGGQSNYEGEPYYQTNFGIPDGSARRGVPDVAYDADPNTGVAVYDSVLYQGQSGWYQVGGTSMGAPQWAALIAIADSLRAAAGKARLSNGPSISPFYSAAWTGTKDKINTTNYHDITSGTNGTCGMLCTSMTGYDYVTGLGSPKANALISALAKY